MRLIDLDKIDVFHQEDEDVVFDIIHAIPVDAITTDWIEQYIENEIQRYGCEIPEISAIKNMLNEWRKEEGETE